MQEGTEDARVLLLLTLLWMAALMWGPAWPCTHHNGSKNLHSRGGSHSPFEAADSFFIKVSFLTLNS